MWSSVIGRSSVFVFALFLVGCSYLHKNPRPCTPPVCCIPCTYTRSGGEELIPYAWWSSFGSSELDVWAAWTTCGNFSIKEHRARLYRAYAQTRLAYSNRGPDINLISAIGSTQITHGDNFADLTGGFGSDNLGIEGERYNTGPALAYEWDVWGKLLHRARADCMRAKATREELLATWLTVTGELVNAYLTVKEQAMIEALLEEQIASNEVWLELIELRYSVSQATAVDYYQQAQQVAGTKALLPPVRARRIVAEQRAAVLMGLPPGSICHDACYELPELPPLPEISCPITLLHRRPDVRAAWYAMAAEDEEVAAAIADFLPTVGFSLSYVYSLLQAFVRLEAVVLSMLARISEPLYDAGRRCARLDARRAARCERLQAYANRFLVALQEVEQALVEEEEQKVLLERLEEQLDMATKNLEQSRLQYVSGLSDYLPVVAALNAQQTLQRVRIREHKRLLEIRSNLYRALGGGLCGVS